MYFIYFWFTNKDIFKYVVCRLDEKLKQTVRVTRASAMKKLDIARKKQVRVDTYFDYTFRFKKVDDNKDFYDRQTIIQVFDQNHFNLVVIQGLIFIMVLVLGIFKDQPAFQLPAAASFIILLTILVMLAGAFSYWFGSWSGTMSLLIFLGFNYLAGQDFFSKPEKAFGLNYSIPPAEYSVKNLQALASPDSIERDRANTLQILNNWKAKFPEEEKPKMVFISVSGGGKRAALWTMTALQTVDSLTNGNALDKTTLITGASGGLIGASYYRELKLRKSLGESVNPNALVHRTSVSTDNLNPLIFSFLANGIFVGLTKFEYAGREYVKDRAFTFEQELDEITNHLMDRTLASYREPEFNAVIPMMVLTPIITNDGRKLNISPQPVSYLNAEVLSDLTYDDNKIGGVDFRRLFKAHQSDSLRFLSALRMSATFPYITPNTTLPTQPSIQIMDAGVSDNFGLSTTVRFLFAFKEWIAQNTSGVILLSIRDSPKLGSIPPQQSQTIIDNITQPISNVYNNLENFQDINNDALIGQASAWLNCPMDRIELQYQYDESYVPILQKMDSIRQNNARASLSWRLTGREKQSVMNNIHSQRNRKELDKLIRLLEPRNLQE
ncbi:MAG: patatin-like phospholipase family protein [Cytophagales bacterium]